MLNKKVLARIEEEVNAAKYLISTNIVSGGVDALNRKLGKAWDELALKGIVEYNGTDAELRPVFVTLQGIIERAVAKGLAAKEISQATATIITPRMPTPLMLDSSKDLQNLDFSDPKEFAFYRHPILQFLLQAGGVVRAIYSHNAKTALSNDATGLANYAVNLEEYSNLIDSPILKIDMKDFPSSLTGAMYSIDGYPITIESRQVTQVDNANSSSWAIRFGDKAKDRVDFIEKELDKNTDGWRL